MSVVAHNPNAIVIRQRPNDGKWTVSATTSNATIPLSICDTEDEARRVEADIVCAMAGRLQG